MIKFEKYEHSAFTGKKNDKFEQKAKILQKNENAHEIRKKTTGLCPGVLEHAYKMKLKGGAFFFPGFCTNVNICAN